MSYIVFTCTVEIFFLIPRVYKLLIEYINLLIYTLLARTLPIHKPRVINFTVRLQPTAQRILPLLKSFFIFYIGLYFVLPKIFYNILPFMFFHPFPRKNTFFFILLPLRKQSGNVNFLKQIHISVILLVRLIFPFLKIFCNFPSHLIIKFQSKI